MAKIQNSKNPIRSAQNVGRVLISMEGIGVNSKRAYFDQKMRRFFGEKIGVRGMGEAIKWKRLQGTEW